MKKRELYDPIEPFDTGFLQVGSGHRDLLRAVRQSARQAGACSCTAGPAAAATPNAAALLRSRALPHRAVRPARLRARSTPHASLERQHDLGSRRRHRALARASRHRALAGVRRLVGQHARARLRRDAPRARHRARAARHLPAAPQGARLVLPGGRELRSSPRRGEEYLDADSRRRSAATCSSAYHRRLTERRRRRCSSRRRARGAIWEGATSSLLPDPSA